MTDAKQPRTQAEIDADVALAQASAEEKRNLARKALAEALKAEAEAEAFGMDLAKKHELRDLETASDYHHKVYRFDTRVDEKSVDLCISVLTKWARLHPGCDIEIIFNSPGGSVVDGMALYDYIQELRKAGHKVTTTAYGIAASMAGILLQAGDVRRMGKEAWVLIHQGSFGAQGSVGSVEDTVEWVKKIQERILDIFADRAAASGVEHPIKRAAIKRNWDRKDWWLSSDECLKHGFVDEVL